MIGREAYIDEVMKKCESFKSSGFWPPDPNVRANAWIENFANLDERFYASRLLDNFVYFNDSLSKKLLVSSYHSLPDAVRNYGSSRTFEELMRNVALTAVSGEIPNVTDSGYLFCRNTRQQLGLDENLFKQPIDALSDCLLYTSPSPRDRTRSRMPSSA